MKHIKLYEQSNNFIKTVRSLEDELYGLMGDDYKDEIKDFLASVDKLEEEANFIFGSDQDEYENLHLIYGFISDHFKKLAGKK